MVPIQLKNFTPVGTAIRNVMKEKNGSRTPPVTYMWCAHTVTDRPAIAMVAPISPMYPNIGLRLKTGTTSETIPKNGNARTYTSGWPKNQNRCCHNSAPPLAASKTWEPNLRSHSSANRAAASTGKMIRIRTPVSSTFQVKIGMRNMVMPGARMQMMVVMKLTAPRMLPKPESATPMIHRSAPRPGEWTASDSGAYRNQPKSAAPPGVRKPNAAIDEPNRKSQ